MALPGQVTGFPAGRVIRRLEPGEELSAWRFNQLVDSINALVGSLAVDYRRAERQPWKRPNPYPARITASAVQGSVMRWRYAHEEVAITKEGVVTVVTHGRSGTTAAQWAINLVETYNLADATGTQGNSVDETGADFPTGFDLKPVGGLEGVQVIVLMHELACGSDGHMVYAFTYENAHDGVC